MLPKVMFIFLAIMLNHIASATTMQNKNISAAWISVLGKKWVIPASRYPYQQCFEQAALQHDIPLSVLLAIARGESSFNPNAISKSDAIGIMQIKWPGTAHHLGIEDRGELHQPCLNIDKGAEYFQQLLTRFDNNYHKALAAYNYGPTAISNAANIPHGAAWYSQYILQHHDFVVTTALAASAEVENWQFLTVFQFSHPFRASAIVDRLSRQYPKIRFDWIKKDGKFHVRALAKNEYEKLLVARQFSIDLEEQNHG